MIRVTLRQLEYFVAIAEAGKITMAADRLHLSQSAISTALGELEEELDLKLFVRNPRGLALTNPGRQVLLEARRLLSDAKGLCSHANDLGKSLAGPLKVGCYNTLSLSLLPSVIDTFLTLHPKVELDFVIGPQQKLYRKLNDGSCDVALLYDYGLITDANAAKISKVNLQHFPPHVVLHPEHELAAKAEVSMVDLADQPMILFDQPPGGEYFKALFEMHGITPNIRFRTSEFELIHSLVARGLGFSILTQKTDISISYENRPFVTRPIRDNPHGLNVVAAYASTSTLTRRAQAFIDQCREALEQGAGIS